MGYGYVQSLDGSSITAAYLSSGEYEIESMGEKFTANLHLRSPFDPKDQRVGEIIQSDPVDLADLQVFLISVWIFWSQGPLLVFISHDAHLIPVRDKETDRSLARYPVTLAPHHT